MGRYRIQHVADMVVGRDLLDLEERLRVTLPLVLLHGFLVSEEQGALREEDREGAQVDRLHAVLSVVLGAFLGKSSQGAAQFSDELIEASQAHLLHPHFGWGGGGCAELGAETGH